MNANNRAVDTAIPAAGTSSSLLSPQSSTLFSNAARRVVDILNQNGLSSSSSSSSLVGEDASLDLTRLNLRQLKAVSKALKGTEDFNMPKSGARKYEWVNAIAGFFQSSLHNGVNNTSVGANAYSGTPIAAAAAAAAAKARRSPPKAASHNAAKVRKSPKKAAAHKASNETKHAPKRSKLTTTNSISSDEAMAKALQHQYMQEDMNFMGVGGTLPSNASLLTSAISHGVAAHQQHRVLPNDAVVAGLEANLRSTASSNVIQPKHNTVKVKKEPYHNATATNSHSLSHGEDLPRDARESSLVETMRNMGFNDTREILSGIRAVAAQREEVSIVSAAGWSSQDHVEAAMMWIISQREEAEEARKEDEARFSSERADAEMMQRRKEEREAEMMSSDMQDLLGSVEEEITISSKYFPHSVILQSQQVRQIFATISSVNDSTQATQARREVLRYLKLEKKATDWYGRVLPYSYFQHYAKPRFANWYEKLMQTSHCSSDQISQQLMKESDDLERALYNLSEQEEGGVANVPKVFLQAQRDAALKGLPTKETRDFDDEIEILESSSSFETKESQKRQQVEVIEIS